MLNYVTTMVETLEGKIQAPTVVFADSIEFGGAGADGVRLVMRKGEALESFADFSPNQVEAIYDSRGKPRWQNPAILQYRKAEVPEQLKCLQVVFTNELVYEDANLGANHFSFLENGRYVGHKNFPLDIEYVFVKAIFDGNGKKVWENRNYAQKPQRSIQSITHFGL